MTKRYLALEMLKLIIGSNEDGLDPELIERLFPKALALADKFEAASANRWKDG